MIAQVIDQNLDLADVMFLIAAILFIVGGVIALRADALWAAIVAFGLTAVALGFLVL